VGNTNVGFGQRLKWSPGSDAFYALGQTEVDRFAVPSLQKTVLQSGAAQVLDFSPASGLVALTSNHLSVQLRDLRTQTDRGTITPSGQFGAASLSPDGSLIAFGLLSAIAEEVRSTANGALLATFTGFSTGSPVYSATFAPDGQSLIWLARARVQQMALAGGAFGPAFEHEDFVFDISVADNKIATAFGEGDRVWNLSTGAKLFDVRPANGASAAVLTSDGSLVFVGSKAGISIYDTATATPIVTYGLNGSSLALSPNGCILLAASADGALTVLRASGTAFALQPVGSVIRAPSTGDGGLVGRAFGPD
jgi:WD40 repeat protein